MTRMHRFGMVLACIVLLASSGAAQDLARYRDFEFGMSVESVAKLAPADVASAKVLHKLPELIQTLNWDRQGYFSSSKTTDPVRNIRFDFSNNQLFKIVAIYGSRQLEGMTADDLIEAISKVYGVASRPTDESITVSAYTGYEDRQKVVARWENAENAYNLFQSSYGGEFGIVAYSKKLEKMASASIKEAQRLEVLAAPQREIDRLRKDAEDRRVADEKARTVNQPNFRP